MIIFYVDESGTGFKQHNTPFFVLAAFAIRAVDWQDLDDKVVVLKRRLAPWAKPEDFEIKGRDLRRGERMFRGRNWCERAQVFLDIAQVITELPCRVFAVRVDKRHLPDGIASDAELYRVAFWRLLEELEIELTDLAESGIVLFDSRSDLHSSVQDRRLVDAFREWASLRSKPTRLVELPWFGFSEFYSGLQLADSCAYLVDFISNEASQPARAEELHRAFSAIAQKLKLVDIP